MYQTTNLKNCFVQLFLALKPSSAKLLFLHPNKLHLKLSEFSKFDFSIVCHYFLNFQSGGALQHISDYLFFFRLCYCQRFAQKVTSFVTGMPMDVLWFLTSHQQTQAFSKLVIAESGGLCSWVNWCYDGFCPRGTENN